MESIGLYWMSVERTRVPQALVLLARAGYTYRICKTGIDGNVMNMEVELYIDTPPPSPSPHDEVSTALVDVLTANPQQSIR